MDVASRASKKAPQGLFCPPDYSAGRCCSNPPSRVKLKIPDETKNQRIFYAGFFGGRGWIRTTEAESSRFTVCPHWPLGNTPIFIFVRPFAGRLAYFSMGNGFCQLFFYVFLQMRFPCRETAEQRREKPCSYAGMAKSEKKDQPEEIDRQIARKTRGNM